MLTARGSRAALINATRLVHKLRTIREKWPTVYHGNQFFFFFFLYIYAVTHRRGINDPPDGGSSIIIVDRYRRVFRSARGFKNPSRPSRKPRKSANRA